MGMGLVFTVGPRSLTPSFSRALAGTRWEYRGRGPHCQMPGPQGPSPASARTLAVLGPIRIFRGSPPGRRKRGWDRLLRAFGECENWDAGMSTICPPPSPAVAKTEIALCGESPLLAATFAYWDNILGPRVRHIWAPKTEQVLLSDGEITFLANHTLNGEILRNAESGAIDVKFFVLSEKGVIIVSLIFDGNWNGDRSTYGLSIILPQTELSFYLPLHRVCVDRLTHIIRKGRIWMHKVRLFCAIGSSLIFSLWSCNPVMFSLTCSAISSHLQTCGCSIVVGSSAEKVNKDATGSFVLPFRQVMYAPYPTTHIDVDVNTVKQMPPCHEHIYNQRRYMRSELTAFWRATSEEDMAQDTIIYTDESFTPDLNIFQDVLHRDTLVKAFLDQVFHLKPGLSLRSTFLAQFLLVLHRKALTLIKYIEDDTRKEDKEETMSIALKQVFNKDKTFRPKRKFEPGTQRFELHKRAQASLNSGVDLRAAVQLPSGEDQNDWVAVHVVDFFNRINLIYGTICEFCTERTCPVMSGGPKYEYRWQDDLKYKKPTALPAPQYMNLLMDWIEVQINNEDIFPTCVGESLPTVESRFPPNGLVNGQELPELWLRDGSFGLR
ncbi:hypothetical protein LTLLF_100165 [Microtus ochrogaster]|uniref:Uncharacterized protein n=1 Tax=Microtus ochrogaster TaxID=79684 RepID=A0A8J6H2T1_MICOH|nr:hypothetical protein LTLLF_100165 [Microtus ochrogaster]